MSRANILVSLALSLMSHGAAAEQISAPDLAAIQKAVEAGDGAALVPLLKGKTVTMEAAERDATRLVLLEHLALVAADSTAERSAVGQALLAIAPEDKIGKALAIAEPPAGAPTAEAPLPKEFSLALEKNDGKDLVRLVLSPTLKLSDLHSRAAEIEKAIAEYARPLPASNATDNKEAYRALAKLVPDNATYAEKSQSYAALEAERNESILRKLKKKTDEFNGISFYEHPAKPRYTDTRTYFLPYLGARDGRVWMRFVVHYTAESWLFVEKVSFNVDGVIVPLPDAEWKRDNDSEIWEWADVPVNILLRMLLNKIADSKKTVVRFEGRQYFDNVTISATDKQAIRDMFVAEEALKKQASVTTEKP